MTDTPRPDPAAPTPGASSGSAHGSTDGSTGGNAGGASDPFGSSAGGPGGASYGAGSASYGAGGSGSYGGNYGSSHYGGGAGSRLFDDLARFVTDAAGATQGVRREVEQVIRAQGEAALARMDVVRRDEHEAVAAMAARARAENETLRASVEALSARVGALEARLGGGSDEGAGHPEKN